MNHTRSNLWNLFLAGAPIVLRAIPCPKVVDKANDGFEYERERKKRKAWQASQESREPISLSLSNFLQALQGREILNCFYTPLPAWVHRKDRSGLRRKTAILCSTWPSALFAVCCVSTVVKWGLFASSRLFYGTHQYDMGGLQTSIKFFPEQLYETEEKETKGNLCGSEGSSLLQTGPKFQVRHMENKKI